MLCGRAFAIEIADDDGRRRFGRGRHRVQGGGPQPIVAPMPGRILDVKVSVGDADAKGVQTFPSDEELARTDVLIIHWLQRANGYLAAERERNAALAHTRALLFDELQHRVSNNLQAVAGLLALQRRRVTDPQAAATLAEASQRVALIGRISRRLYDSDENGRDLAAFLTAHPDFTSATLAGALPDFHVIRENQAPPSSLSLRPSQFDTDGFFISALARK
mgnify:CR=1 FL=1